MVRISVYAADIDNDGDMDVLSASYNDDKIAWYENDGAADPALPPELSLPPLMLRILSTPQISITMAIWMSFPHQRDDKIAWYESDGAADPALPPNYRDLR